MTEWEAEMYGVKQMIHKYANIPYDDIVGKFTLDSQQIYDTVRARKNEQDPENKTDHCYLTRLNPRKKDTL